MNNVIMLVGRLIDNLPHISTTKLTIKLAVSRTYKNTEGQYETDYIPCELRGMLTKHTIEYCKKGDLIGVKGRLETNENNNLVVVADKITFLSTSTQQENDAMSEGEI